MVLEVLLQCSNAKLAMSNPRPSQRFCAVHFRFSL